MPLRKYLVNDINFELQKSERKRVGILLIVFLLSVLLVPFMHSVFPALQDNSGNNSQYRIFLISSIILFFLWEIWLFFRLGYTLLVRKPVSPAMHYPLILLEYSLIGIILYFAVKYDNSLLILEYTGLIFYFFLIILSALQLDYRICLLSGFFSALWYTGLAWWSFGFLEITHNLPRLWEIYLLRSGGLLLCGGVIALVSFEVREKVYQLLVSVNKKRRVETMLGQHVSPFIANQLLDENNPVQPKNTEASILFLDIRNFSVFADQKSPREIIDFQTNIFAPLMGIIQRRGGIIHQLMGDGFMASFGIVHPNSNHVLDAYQAGLEILKKINRLVQKKSFPETKIGIGLHVGEVVSGNIGNVVRRQFTIAGKNVVIAARLEQLNKSLGTNYLVTKPIYSRLKNPDELESLGIVTLKGIDNQIEVFRVKTDVLM